MTLAHLPQHQQRIEYKLCTLVYNCLHGVAPDYLPTMPQSVSANIVHCSLHSAVLWRSGCSCY